jgi:hypothetical protein
LVQQKAREIPLAELTLRKYEQPGTLSDRELVRKLCLSLGLLQPGDSRDVVVDVALVLLTANRPLTAREIETAVIDSREASRAPVFGVAPSNIRRQILRMRELFLIEKVASTYRVNENQRLESLFEEHLERYYLASITKRVREYLKTVDEQILAKRSLRSHPTPPGFSAPPVSSVLPESSSSPARDA